MSIYYKYPDYRWDERPPSDPDPKLIDDLARSELIDANRLLCLKRPNDFQLFETLIYQRLNRLLPAEAISKPAASVKRYWYWAAAVVALVGALSTGLVLQQRQTAPSIVPANLSQP